MAYISQERMDRTLAALDAHWTEHASPPTIRELADRLDLTAKSNVHEVLHVALDRGLIWTPETGRTVFVPLWVRDAIRLLAKRDGVE